MDNSTLPLQGDILLINQLELVASTTVAGTFYGIAFTLFCLYVHSLVPQLRDNNTKSQATFMLVYSSVIMLCGLYYIVSYTWVLQEDYIKHNNYPGGPFAYVIEQYHNPVLVICFTCQVIVDLLTSAIQVWRVWVVWSATRYAKFIVLLPLLSFLTFAALHLRTLIIETTFSGEKYRQLDSKTENAVLASQVSTTIVCTAMISLFLVFEQWRQRRLIGQAQGSAGYMKIVAMLIESYALESIWVLLFAVLPNTAHANFFGETAPYIEIIAYLLVQYRVTSGKAYGSHRERSRISSLHWGHSNHATTQFGAKSEGGRESIKPDTSEVVPVVNIA